MRPRSEVIEDLKATMTVALDSSDVRTQNVCAFLKGSDPRLESELVVIGAHYDHLGMKRSGSDRIFNGADDNGSGTTALLAIARALGKSGVRPKRSIALLAFSGEEKGLLGSEFYCAHPLRPLERTVAMFNMDMVGRNYDRGCEVVGTQFSPDLREVVGTAAQGLGLDVEWKTGTGFQRILERSDQAPFYKKNIPIAFFTTGLHKDYHKVSDEWKKINVENLTNVARLVLASTLAVANAQESPQFRRD